MVAVGLIWGATNALIRRGALLYDNRCLRSSPISAAAAPASILEKLISFFKSSISFLLFWQYSVPFLVNLSASATFFALLSDSPISLAVPVTNATTFAATAVFGMLLGEKTRISFALVGTAFIVIGILLCIT
ncbi:Transmembrane protein 234 homolog [Linum perenne]